MLTQIINAKVLTPQGWLENGSVLIEGNKIADVINCSRPVVGAKLVDAKGMVVAPGGVEIHVHGGGGRDFCRGGGIPLELVDSNDINLHLNCRLCLFLCTFIRRCTYCNNIKATKKPIIGVII